MRQLWAAGLLLRRLRSEIGALTLIFILVASTAFVFAAAPRIFNRVSDDALRWAVDIAGPGLRNVTATLTENIPAPTGTGVQSLRRFGQNIEDGLPATLTSLFGERTVVATSSRFLVDQPPLYDTRILFRIQDAIPDVAATLVDGRWPADLGQPVQTVPIGDRPNEPDPGPPTRIEAAIAAAAATEVGMKVGDVLTISLDGSDGLINRVPYVLGPTEIEIVGLFEAVDADADVWFADPALLEASQHGSEDQPIAYVTAYVALDAYPNIAAAGTPFRYEWRYLTDPDRVDASLVPQLQGDLRRMAVLSSGVAPGSLNVPSVNTGLPRVLERYETERALSESVLSIAAIGPFGLAAGAMAMVSLLLIRRRQSTLALARGRGASGSLVLGTQLWESILIAGSASIVGLLLALAIVPSRPSPLSLWFALAVGLLATFMLVGASWAVARRPLGNVERDDVLATKVTTRRLVIEATIVVIALGAALLLRQRGLSVVAAAAGTGGATTVASARFDPLLASVPVLAGLAAGIIVLRLYPLPIQALGWLAAQGRGFVAVLGLRTIGRHPGVANLPLLVLLLTAAFGAFSSVLATSIDRGQVAASYIRTGADFRIERVGAGSMAQPKDLAAVPGVEAVATGLAQRNSVLTDRMGQRATIYVLAIEPREYATVTAGTAADPQWPTDMLGLPTNDEQAAGTPDNPIPAILSRKLPIASILNPGDVFELTIAGRPMTFRLSEVRTSFPGINQDISFAVVPFNWVNAAFGQPRSPSLAWLRAPIEATAGVKAAVAKAAFSTRMVSRHVAYAGLKDNPLEAVISLAYGTALVIAAIYMGMAIIGAIVLSAAGRTRDLAYLRTLGVTGRQSLGLTVMEHGPPVLLAILPGVALGIGIALLAEPGLGLATFVGVSGVPLFVDWLALASMVGVLVAIVAGSVALGTWFSRRARPSDALRLGDH